MLKMRASVTLVTGFLGAGKTTLINQILRATPKERLAVMVNDFGDVNVDAQLVVGMDGDTVELSNGCICCTIREDLVDALLKLLRRKDCPDRILVETSGVADPVPVASTFAALAADGLVGLDGVVAVVDAEHFDELSDKDRTLRDRQVRLADLVVLNKADLCPPDALDALQTRLESALPHARMIRSVQGNVPLEVLLGIDAGPKPVPATTDVVDVHVHGAHDHADHDHDHNHDHDDHDPSLHAFGTWTFEPEAPLHLDRTIEALKTLPATVYRAKGYLKVAGEEVPVVAQVVGRRVRLHRETDWGDRTPKTQLVLLGRLPKFDADALVTHFEPCTRTGVVERSLGATMDLVRDLLRPRSTL